MGQNIGERLVEIRKSLTITQGDFARSLGFSSGNGLSMIELGKTQLQPVYYKVLESTYNVNIEWLKTGEGDMFINKEPIINPNINYNLSEMELKDKYINALEEISRLKDELLTLKMGGNNLGKERDREAV